MPCMKIIAIFTLLIPIFAPASLDNHHKIELFENKLHQMINDKMQLCARLARRVLGTQQTLFVRQMTWFDGETHCIDTLELLKFAESITDELAMYQIGSAEKDAEFSARFTDFRVSIGDIHLMRFVQILHPGWELVLRRQIRLTPSNILMYIYQVKRSLRSESLDPAEARLLIRLAPKIAMIDRGAAVKQITRAELTAIWMDQIGDPILFDSVDDFSNGTHFVTLCGQKEHLFAKSSLGLWEQNRDDPTIGVTCPVCRGNGTLEEWELTD